MAIDWSKPAGPRYDQSLRHELSQDLIVDGKNITLNPDGTHVGRHGAHNIAQHNNGNANVNRNLSFKAKKAKKSKRKSAKKSKRKSAKKSKRKSLKRK
jgi:hypothetical protein